MPVGLLCGGIFDVKQAGGIKVFIRYDVHAVRAGIKLKGQPPLNNPKVYR